MKTNTDTQFGIGTKLIIALGSLIGISAIIGGLAVLSMLSIQSNTNDLSQQFVPEVVVVNEIERQTLKMMLDVRGYWMTTDPKYYDLAAKEIADLDKALGEAQALLERSPKLVKLQANLPKALSAKATYAALLTTTKTNTEEVVKARAAMDEGAKQFLDAIDGYLSNQYESARAEIRAGARAAALTQRLDKIDSGNEILALGNAVRVANFKTQALRDSSYVTAVLPNFDKI